MSWPIKQTQEPLLKCPQCKGKFAHIINFGKKAHCWNCRYVWDLLWKGSKNFSTEVRQSFV